MYRQICVSVSWFSSDVSKWLSSAERNLKQLNHSALPTEQNLKYFKCSGHKNDENKEKALCTLNIV